MSQDVEIVLKFPNQREGRGLRDALGHPIINDRIRFVQRWTVETLPKVQDRLTLQIAAVEPCTAVITYVQWDDDLDLFRVLCHYATRPIMLHHLLALAKDPSWKMTPLPFVK